jgi:sarcosine oxidase / L-pipecolate oxidase
MVDKDSKIIVVGGGVFGLSTSLWLARGGYRDITVFDRCQFDKNFYNPADGCDGASADLNKIFRISYAEKLHYQDMAIEARNMWMSWNNAIASSDASALPPGLEPDDKLLHECGCYYVGDGQDMKDYYAESLRSIERTAPHLRKKQFIKGRPEDEEQIRALGGTWAKKFHVVDKINGGDTNGFLDTNAGVTIADKACTYAHFLCEQAGVKFVLGDPQGKLKTLIKTTSPNSTRVTGIETWDGKIHHADLVIVAAGGWTASILPEAHRTVESTAGTLMFIDIPEDRQDLREKFHPDNYPVWHYRRGSGDTYYQGGSFPITKSGRLKFGFRGKKFTNFEDHPTEPNLRVSTPRTKYTDNPIHTVPAYGLSKMKEVLYEALPELREFEFTDSRLCWYTDSIDNEYVIDYVPGYDKSLFICTGGSGHAFKFLPILGRHVKNQLEGVEDQFSQLWKWRTVTEGQSSNGLEEGESGARVLAGIEMASRKLLFLPTFFRSCCYSSPGDCSLIG